MSLKHQTVKLSFLALALCSCNSPQKIATEFCQGHATGKLEKSYPHLASRDKIEQSLDQYRQFNWNKQSFDLRLLQGQDNCAATVTPLTATEAMATLNISRRGGGTKVFNCLLPLVKEDDVWRVTSHWQPAVNHQESLKKLRTELKLQYEDMAGQNSDDYLSAASAPLAKYFEQLDQINTTFVRARGPAQPFFCFSNLNPDNGQDLAYNYLIFEDKISGLPTDIVQQRQRYSAYLKELRDNYKPLTTTVTRGVRMDLVGSELIKQKADGGRILYQIQYRFIFWGKVHGPLSWHLALFDANDQQVQEGFGKEAEMINDFPLFIADAPELTMVIITLPRLPSYTKKATVTFTEPDQITSYQLELPLQNNYLEIRR